jgi:hypothetical protein
MKRLTYNKFETKLQNANDLISTKGDLLLTEIDVTTFEFKVTLDSTGSILSEGKGRSLPEAKKLVKQALIDNNISFLTETRGKEVITLESINNEK